MVLAALTLRRMAGWLCVMLLINLPALARAEVFDLPAQALAEALADFSRITDRPVVFKPEVVQGLSAPPLRAELAPEEALTRLLKNTSLMAQASGEGWLIIRDRPPAVPPPKDSPALNELVVVGRYSDALERALIQKRHANRHQDVILAERIGEFPALNVAEAIKRSPGVSVVRDRGEALFISIRGLPTQFNTLTLNGEPVATNENTRTSEQYGRRFHYDTLPAELIAGLEVRKSPQARDPEGAIGGSVNLKTFQPLSLEAPTLNVTTAVSHSELADRQDPRASIIGSWRNSSETFGALIGATYSERHLRQDRALNFRWETLSPKAVDTPSSLQTAISPGSVRPTLELEHRRRTGLNAALQWRVNGHTEIDLNWLGLNQRIGYREYSYSADYDPAGLNPASIEWRDSALIAGQTSTGSSQIGTESTELSDRFQTQTLKLRHHSGLWQWRTSLTHSTTRSYNSDPIRRTRLRRENHLSFTFRYFDTGTKQLPSIELLQDQLDSPTSFPGRRLEWRKIDAEDTHSGLTVSAGRRFEHSPIQWWETGLQWRERQRDYQRRDALITAGVKGQHFPLAHFYRLPVTDFLSHQRGNLPQHWWVPDESTFWENVGSKALSEGASPSRDQLNSYDIRETIHALFSQVNWSRGAWRGDLGVRFALANQRSSGYQWNSENPSPTPVTITNHYGYWLPSFNTVYQPSKNHLWRFSVARTINRPDLQDLSPRLTPNSGDRNTAVGGNPYLAPTKAWQAELAWEWYFARQGLFSIGTFLTELEDFVQDDILDIELEGERYELTTKTNGAQASVMGLEVDLQHMVTLPSPLLGRVGVQANVTLTDSNAHYRQNDTRTTDDLADVSAHTVNLGLVYEGSRLDARAHFNWRDRVLKNVGTATLASQDSEPFGTLDAQIAYHLSEALSITLEGVNLTDSAEWESVAGEEFAGYTYYGRTFLAGLKARF